jgi:maleate cis-trans isomerase
VVPNETAPSGDITLARGIWIPWGYHCVSPHPKRWSIPLARQVDTPEAEAVFISGTGLPTLTVLDMLEQDLRKPVFSSATAMMWLALRTARVGARISGYGSLMATV